MKRNTYFPIRIGDQIIWVGNFGDKLTHYAAELGLKAEVLAAILADCAWLIYCLQKWQPAVRIWAQSSTTVITEMETGTDTDVQVLPLFIPPPLPTGVVAVLPGVLTRLFAFIQILKRNPKCIESISIDLGIIGSAQIGPDLTSIQPVFTLSIVGGQVVLHSGFGGYAAYLDAIEWQVNRNDGKGSVPLVVAITPNYTDLQPFPVASTVWTYSAIFLLNNVRVGVWSQSVSIAVQA